MTTNIIAIDPEVEEFFVISRLYDRRSPCADLTAEEAHAVEKLGIKDVEWCTGNGIYARREDATAVMANLALIETSSWFRVVSSHEDQRCEHHGDNEIPARS